MVCLLGGSWVVICGIISRVSIVISHIRGLVTPLTTTHEPPSMHNEDERSWCEMPTQHDMTGVYVWLTALFKPRSD